MSDRVVIVAYDVIPVHYRASLCECCIGIKFCHKCYLSPPGHYARRYMLFGKLVGMGESYREGCVDDGLGWWDNVIVTCNDVPLNW